MPYDPINNYEVSNIDEEPNGEIVTLANGTTAFLVKSGGRWVFRATFEGDFFVQANRFYKVGDIFTHNGISFIVEAVSLSGLNKIRANDGLFYDGRHFTLTARSTQAYDSPVDIHNILAGE